MGCGFLGQELGGALQWLARLSEATELQPGLAQQMQRLPGVGPRFGHLRQQRLGAGEVAGRCTLHGVARQGLDLEVGESHLPRLAEGQARQNGFRASNRIWPALRPRSRWVQ